MATTRILLGIICFAFTGSFAKSDGDLLARGRIDTAQIRQRNLLVHIAAAELGVRELTGNNDGKKVEAYLASARLTKGNPWCAAYLTWVFKKAGFSQPRTGWSPSLFPASRLTKAALPGDIIGIYFPDMKRVAHVGLLERIDGDWCISIEGNTSGAGSREGNGVFRKRRHIRTIYQFADWVSPKSVAQ